jgi:hypothetical protein
MQTDLVQNAFPCQQTSNRRSLRLLETIVTDLINTLPGNSSVNMVQHATIEEAVFPIDVTDAQIDWLDSTDTHTHTHTLE